MTIKIHDVMLTREGAEVGDLPYVEPVRMVEYADHFALVAAAYRDAEDACANCAPAPAGGPFSHTNSMRVIAADCQNAVSRRTPADAEAHLTALLRAEYERGVKEAAKACDWGDIYGDNAVRCILALLTQEGR